MDNLLNPILSQGLLGVIVIILAFVCRHLYTRNQQQNEEWQKKYDALAEKYIAKSDQWVEKSREIALNTNAVLDAVIKKGIRRP